MKKIFLFIVISLLFLSFPHSVLGITTTPTPTEEAENGVSKQINSLKERIASKVAELKLVEKRGTAGVVDNALDTSLQMTTTTGRALFVDVDEITKFASGSAKDIGISDFTKGTKVSILGLYNKQSKRILARYISVITIPRYITGTVSAVDSENFTITVTGADKKSTIIDIENTTRTSQYTAGAVARSGFSRITVGSRVTVAGYPDKTENDRISASRILTFPELLGKTSSNTVTNTPPTTTAVTPTRGAIR